MAKSVGADRLVDSGSTGNTPHDPARDMVVEAPSVRADDDGPGQALTNGDVDRSSRAWCQRHRHHLPTFAHHGQRTWPRSSPRASMSAPIASENVKPFRASSEMRACSAGEPRLAATKSSPTSLRSRPTAWN